MPRDFLAVVKILPSNAGGTGSVPGRGTKIPHASPKKPKHKKKKTKNQKQYCNKFNKDLKKKMVHIKKIFTKKKRNFLLKKKRLCLKLHKGKNSNSGYGRTGYIWGNLIFSESSKKLRFSVGYIETPFQLIYSFFQQIFVEHLHTTGTLSVILKDFPLFC